MHTKSVECCSIIHYNVIVFTTRRSIRLLPFALLRAQVFGVHDFVSDLQERHCPSIAELSAVCISPPVRLRRRCLQMALLHRARL